ncbi:MAG: hypothetical protein IKI75_10495 [Lachnospiraceae bacterium]|nr:hypothetical protein [Lachnospiraceae bacterium]
MKSVDIDLNDSAYVRADRMRYEKNRLSSNLAILSIVLNGLFFISIYKSNAGTYYYNLLMGASIVYNMLFMLVVFLVSEGSKSYHITYSYIAIAVGILQFARIAVFPMRAHNAEVVVQDVSVKVMEDGQFFRVLVYLIGSGVCLLASAVIGIMRANTLSAHLRSLESR